jgi:pimeloyl-ACP methyl ester carboxylesterase
MAPPDWFQRALAMPPEEHRVEVLGCPIHWVRWGHQSSPGIVLVHGGAAHTGWWSFLAPFFASQYHVVALDLSGHGDSGRRDRYPRRVFADEVMGVIDDAGFAGPPVVVGHSMGGLVAILAASLYGEKLDGAVIVDAPVRRPDPESQEVPHGRGRLTLRSYPRMEDVTSRFRLVPEQPCDNGFLLEHLAKTSVRKTDDGWAWKFDANVFFDFALEAAEEHLSHARCRIALIRGELSSVVPPDVGQYMFELLGRAAPVVEIPEAHHHLMLDQPLAFVAALRALLSDWAYSVPKGR